MKPFWIDAGIDDVWAVFRLARMIVMTLLIVRVAATNDDGNCRDAYSYSYKNHC
jgi:hypothetical protein